MNCMANIVWQIKNQSTKLAVGFACVWERQIFVLHLQDWWISIILFSVVSWNRILKSNISYYTYWISSSTNLNDACSSMLASTLHVSNDIGQVAAVSSLIAHVSQASSQSDTPATHRWCCRRQQRRLTSWKAASLFFSFIWLFISTFVLVFQRSAECVNGERIENKQALRGFFPKLGEFCVRWTIFQHIQECIPCITDLFFNRQSFTYFCCYLGQIHCVCKCICNSVSNCVVGLLDSILSCASHAWVNSFCLFSVLV